MSERKHKPRTGLMLVVVAVGAGTLGYLVGRSDTPDTPPNRPSPRMRAEPAVVIAAATPEKRGEPVGHAPPGSADGRQAKSDPADGAQTPKQYIASIREHAGTERGQTIVQGLIADAARLGEAALPEIRELLESGEDIKFARAKDGSGLPSLRVALLQAAAATGSPAAAALVAEVAETTESTVEVVFSAHVLDRLDALEPSVAQRTLDSVAGGLDEETRRAVGSIAAKVVRAAAKTDPAYAEVLLNTQLRSSEPEAAAGVRYLSGALYSLPTDRARDVTVSALTATDVTTRNKMAVARVAAQRGALLPDVKRAIETRAVEPKVAATAAWSSLSGPTFDRANRRVRRALKEGDLDGARSAVRSYQQRLGAARETIEAARGIGAKLNVMIDTRAKMRTQALDSMRQRVRRAVDKAKRAEQQAAKAAAKNR